MILDLAGIVLSMLIITLMPAAMMWGMGVRR